MELPPILNILSSSEILILPDSFKEKDGREVALLYPLQLALRAKKPADLHRFYCRFLGWQCFQPKRKLNDIDTRSSSVRFGVTQCRNQPGKNKISPSRGVTE